MRNGLHVPVLFVLLFVGSITAFGDNISPFAASPWGKAPDVMVTSSDNTLAKENGTQVQNALDFHSNPANFAEKLSTQSENANSNADRGTLSFYNGLFIDKLSNMSDTAFALSFLDSVKTLLGIQDVQKEFVISERTNLDKYGINHICFTQVFNGIPVENSFVSITIKNGKFHHSSLTAFKTPAIEGIGIFADNELRGLVAANHPAGKITSTATITMDTVYIYYKSRCYFALKALVYGSIQESYCEYINLADGSLIYSYPLTNYETPVTGSGTDSRGSTRSLYITRNDASNYVCKDWNTVVIYCSLLS